MLSLLLSITVLSSTLKSEITGGVLSVCIVVMVRLSVEELPAASWTVKVSVLLVESLRVGLENDLVKV